MTPQHPAAPGSIALRNAGPWEHLDGTPCPHYVAGRPRPNDRDHWWCTEHQQHVRTVIGGIRDRDALISYLEVRLARAESAEAAHAALRAGVEALGDEPVAPYPAECSCSHGMGFQFHAYPCRYSREVPRSAVRALLAGGKA